jgi:betaine reductase
MMARVRIVHYLNQFFAGVGGEAKAGHPVSARPGPLGPGTLLQKLVGDAGEVALTVYSGDNHFAEKTEDAVRDALRFIEEAKPHVVVAGPAFNAGRYGTACAVLCRRVQAELGIPAVTAMFRENPGFEMCRAAVPVVPTGEDVTGMAAAMPIVARLALKLGRGEPLGRPEEDGYAPRGQRRNEVDERTGAQRAVAMLLDKLEGRPFVSEIPVPDFGLVVPAPPIGDLSHAKIAMVTTGGVVPHGNPDGIESRRATRWGKYSIAGLDRLDAEKWTSVHGGFDTQFIQGTPDRQLPLDILRDLEREGVIGDVHEFFYSTVGAGGPVHRARGFGQEIAADLKASGVQAVIFTST